MNVPLVDLKGQYAGIRTDLRAALDEVLEAQRFILGPQVARLEAAMAARCGVGHAVGVASGTDALMLALRAAGVGAGDEVITTPFTFIATAGAIWNTGARPVFSDIDPATFNLDPAQVAATCSSRTRAIVTVDLFGQCADFDAIRAAAPGVPIIEDAAQAIGAEDRGRPAGSLGDIAAFSFFPTKNIGAYGDGGMVTTNDPALGERVRRLRAHGSAKKYYHDEVGFNSRLDEIQAAILNVKLRHLDEWNGKRRDHAAYYATALRGAGVTVPAVRVGVTHVYHQYVIRSRRRDALQAFLRERGVGSEVYYPLPLHLQKCFATLGYKAGDVPHAEQAAREALAIPVAPELTATQREYVVEALVAFASREGGVPV